jgi:MFS family permease
MLDSLRSNPRVRGLAALYAGTFLSGAWAIIIPTIPVLAREFGVSAGGAAQIVTAFAVGKFVGTVIAGIVLDRMGTRIALVGGPMVASVAALGAAWVPWFIAMLALALVMGAADSLWATAREIAGIDLAQRHRRGRVISSLHGTYNIGTAMGPFLGGWLTDVFSFKAAFVAYAIATALSVFLGIAGPDFPVAPATKKVADPLGGWGLAALKRRVLGLGDLFKEIHPDLRATYLALCLATLSSQSQRIIVQSMLPLYAGAYLQLSPTQIGMLFTISGIIVIAMIIPAGFIMDRVGRKWCTVPSTGIPALVFVLIPLTSSFMQLAFLVAVAGLAQGLSLGSVATSTYDVVPAHVRGRLQAVRRTVAELGSGLAPLFGGYLANTFNPGVPFLFYAPLLAVSATLLGVVGKETLER